MASRLKLQEELEKILGSNNVYFQPPASVKLKYPCIIYNLDTTFIRRADNKMFMSYNRYHVKHIFKSLEKEKKDTLLSHFMMITHDNRIVADGLYNDDFTLYY
jgi:hypothetical protein